MSDPRRLFYLALRLFAGAVFLAVAVLAADLSDGSAQTTPRSVQSQWSSAHMSRPRLMPVTAVVGNKVLIAGGECSPYCGGIGVSNIVDIYDSAVGRWSVAHLSQARVPYAVATIGQKVLIAGGYFENAGGFSDVVDIYDDATGTWSAATLSEPSGAPAMATVGRKVFFGGTCIPAPARQGAGAG
jgi:hypothetical protein